MLIKQNKVIPLVISMLMLSACSNSSREIAESSQVVAKVNDKEITTSYVERRVSRLSPLARKALRTKNGQKDFIDSLVSKELILQAARKEGLNKSAGFVTQVRDYKKDLLAQTFLQKKLLDKRPKLTEKEIRDYYDSQQESFKEQEEVRLSHIFLLSEVEAKDVLKELKNGADFAKLAFEKSANRKTAPRGGDMGYLRKWQLPPTVADKVFAMEAGQLSEVIPSDFGYTIIKVSDKRMGKAVALEVVAAAIKNKLLRDKQREMVNTLVEELKKNAQVTVNESVLASLNFSLGGEPGAAEKPKGDNLSK